MKSWQRDVSEAERKFVPDADEADGDSREANMETLGRRGVGFFTPAILQSVSGKFSVPIESN